MTRHSLLRILQAGVVLGAAVLAMLRFAAIDAGSNSASDTLRPWLIQLGLIGLVALVVVLVLDHLATREARREA